MTDLSIAFTRAKNLAQPALGTATDRSLMAAEEIALADALDAAEALLGEERLAEPPMRARLVRGGQCRAAPRRPGHRAPRSLAPRAWADRRGRGPARPGRIGVRRARCPRVAACPAGVASTLPGPAHLRARGSAVRSQLCGELGNVHAPVIGIGWRHGGDVAMAGCRRRGHHMLVSRPVAVLSATLMAAALGTTNASAAPSPSDRAPAPARSTAETTRAGAGTITAT